MAVIFMKQIRPWVEVEAKGQTTLDGYLNMLFMLFYAIYFLYLLGLLVLWICVRDGSCLINEYSTIISYVC